jgi:hypothetical protein
MLRDLPTTSFAEIAVELVFVARQQAYGVEALEIEMARNAMPEELLARISAQAKRSAMLVGDAQRLLRVLAECEGEVRQLVASLACRVPEPVLQDG